MLKVKSKFDKPVAHEPVDTSQLNVHMLEINNRVYATGVYNFRDARIPVPSSMNTILKINQITNF